MLPVSLDTPPRLQSRRGVPGPIRADAADEFWRQIEPVCLRENLGGGVPEQATQVRTAWDDTGWRVLFSADDTAPWATLIERDAPLWNEEVVEVFIDPVGDGQSYFEIEINPLGAVADLVLRRTASGWRKDFAWDVEGLVSQVRRTPEGWAAELAIPFAALGPEARPHPGRCWRVNFLRIDRPAGHGDQRELSAWSPTGMPNFHRFERFGTVEFVE